MSIRTDLPNLPPIPGTGTSMAYQGPNGIMYSGEDHSRLYETLFRERPRTLFSNNITRGADPMSALDSAKIRFLHQKILERFEESPTSADEELLQLFDFNLPNVISTYQSLGRSEHPIFTRDRWLSEAAAKMTDEGYATWLNKSTGSQKVYHYSGDTIRLRNPVPAPEPTWPFEAQAPQIPIVAAADYDELIRATAIAPPAPFSAPFPVRGFDTIVGSPAPMWPAATNVTESGDTEEPLPYSM